MQEKTVKQDQNLILENRKNLSISGITDVDSFDEKSIELYTQLGELKMQLLVPFLIKFALLNHLTYSL